MTKNIIFRLSNACSIGENQFKFIFKNFEIYTPKIPIKYSKKGQNFAMSNITLDVLFETS